MKTNKEGANSKNADTLWRKPITLESFEDEDPLATLYRGREVEDFGKNIDESARNKRDRTVAEKSKKLEKPAGDLHSESKQIILDSKTEKAAIDGKVKISGSPGLPKVSEEELKKLLRIKSDSFQFTDIREILRGKSFDMYAYLRFLSGEADVCKIKHLDLMKKLDISRPTLFKQGEWLIRLGLIEKRNVPGDHLGTSYIIHRVESVLPVPANLVKQINSQIENYRQEKNT